MHADRHPSQPKASGLRQAFDIFFVMGLCFVTLFASMLLQGPDLVDSGKHINYLSVVTPVSVTAIVVILAAYLAYLLTRSNRQLHTLVHTVYDPPSNDDTAPRQEERPTRG